MSKFKQEKSTGAQRDETHDELKACYRCGQPVDADRTLIVISLAFCSDHCEMNYQLEHPRLYIALGQRLSREAHTRARKGESHKVWQELETANMIISEARGVVPTADALRLDLEGFERGDARRKAAIIVAASACVQEQHKRKRVHGLTADEARRRFNPVFQRQLIDAVDEWHRYVTSGTSGRSGEVNATERDAETVKKE